MNKFYYYFIQFILAGFLGFIIESVWCVIRNHKLESHKGLIYEPIIPIYSVAGLLFAIFITKFKLKNKLLIFASSIIISSIIEYLSSYLQEKLLHSKSWDYSNFPLNINGRINLIYCLLFGIVIVIWYDFCYLRINHLFTIIDTNIIYIISFLLFILFVFGCFISSISVRRVYERQNNIVRNSSF